MLIVQGVYGAVSSTLQQFLVETGCTWKTCANDAIRKFYQHPHVDIPIKQDRTMIQGEPLPVTSKFYNMFLTPLVRFITSVTFSFSAIYRCSISFHLFHDRLWVHIPWPTSGCIAAGKMQQELMHRIRLCLDDQKIPRLDVPGS